MNETDFIRQQLGAERAHLREVLQTVRHGLPDAPHARPVTLYIHWAGARLVKQLTVQAAALQVSSGLDADSRAQLAKLAAAAARTGATDVEHLLTLLEAWSDSLDALAVRTLRIAHWRRVADLNADAILEERQLYAAARGAVGLR